MELSDRGNAEAAEATSKTARYGDLLADVFSTFPDDARDESMLAFSRHVAQLGTKRLGIHLCPDGRIVDASQPDPGASQRGIFIADTKIGQIFSSRYGSPVTETETRVLRGLIAGMTLKEISTADGVSYQTRRNQLKAIMEKARVTRQTELVVTISTLLVLSATQDEDKSRLAQGKIRDFVDRYYPKQARIFSPRLADGTSMLILDMGPPTGMPVLHMHSAFFPVFPFPPDMSALTALNLRVITPMRPGFFGLPVDWQAPAEVRIENFTGALAGFLDDFDLADIPVFSHAHGIVAAISLCRRLGNRVPRLIGHGAQYVVPDQQFRQRVHIRGHFRLLERSPRLLVEVYRLLAHAVVRPTKLKETLENIFGDSLPDMAALSDPAYQAWLFHIISKVGRDNIPGIVSDIQTTQEDWLKPLMSLSMPISLIYGREDSYSNHLEVAKCVDGKPIDLRLKDNEGLISMMFHPNAILADIAEHHPRRVHGNRGHQTLNTQ